MCNRYSSTKNEARLQAGKIDYLFALVPRFNIAPQNRATVVLPAGEDLVARDMRWGMAGFEKLVTNAKSESARFKTLFRNAWAQRRCLIPADGFYEWKTEGRVKLPYRFVRKDEAPFYFAGLWQEETSSSPENPGDQPSMEERFVILTRMANEDVRRVHTRMPLILGAQEIELWLSPDTTREWVPQGIPEGALRSYRVGEAVSKPGLETPDCVAPLTGVFEQAEFW